jgi:hypothetical protein
MVEVFGTMYGKPFSVVVERSQVADAIRMHQDATEGPFCRVYTGPPVAAIQVATPTEEEETEIPF